MVLRVVGPAVRGLVVAGAALLVPVLSQAAALVVGQVAPLTGVEATQGRGYSAGLKLAFDQANAAGTLGGNTLALVVKDGGSRSDSTLAATKELLASATPPIALAGYFGTPTVPDLVASGVLDKERVPLVGYRGAQVPANLPYVFSLRAGLAEQVDRIVQHVATLGITKIGVIYDGGPQEADTVAAVQRIAEQRKVEIVAKAVQPAATTRVSPDMVAAMQKGAPQAILILSSNACAAFVEGYRSGGGGAALFATADTDVEQLAKRLGDEQLRGISIAQVTPGPTKMSARIVRDFQSAYKSAKADQPASFAMIEGYIAGRVLVEGVRRAGPTPTRDSLAKALDSIDRLDLGDYVIGFRPGMHTGSRFVDLSIVTSSGQVTQ